MGADDTRTSATKTENEAKRDEKKVGKKESKSTRDGSSRRETYALSVGGVSEPWSGASFAKNPWRA